MRPALHWIDASTNADVFPPISEALDTPNGLLAAGGDLSVTRLLAAYRQGIFPWFDDGQPVLWWSPDPRTVLAPREFHCSRSLIRTIRRQPFTVSFNQDFARVIDACAQPRPFQPGTWITTEMQSSYNELHSRGYAFSVEVWLDEQLAGGMYGVCIDAMLFGESMFSCATDASKVAMLALTRRMSQLNLALLDCQVESEHLYSLGAKDITRTRFASELKRLCGGQLATSGRLTAKPQPALNFLKQP